MALSHSKWLRLFIYGGFGLIIFSLYYNYQVAKLFLIPTELEKQLFQEMTMKESKLRNVDDLFKLKIKEHKRSGYRTPIYVKEDKENSDEPTGPENNDFGMLVSEAAENSAFLFMNYSICFLLFFTGFLPFFLATDGSKLKFFGQEVLGFLIMSSLMLTFRYFLN